MRFKILSIAFVALFSGCLNWSGRMTWPKDTADDTATIFDSADTDTDTDTDTVCTDVDNDGYAVEGGLCGEIDCDDTDEFVNPDATEVCDSFDVDEDCNGFIDDADAGVTGQTAWYPDADGDGHGDDTATPRVSCDSLVGEVASNDDCDDGEVTVYFGAPELCDDLDNDCNGSVDDGLLTDLYYEDADSDGYGSNDPSDVLEACTQPTGYVDNSEDCDDTNFTINPDGTEICDENDADEDCDGFVEEGDTSVVGAVTWHEDADGDGFGNVFQSLFACDQPSGYVRDETDCDDTDEFVNPDAIEVCDSFDVDEDCNGFIDDADAGVTGQTAWYPDADGDGHGDDTATPRVSCDSLVDEVASNDDCDDMHDDVHPFAYEVCDDGEDNDCDGLVDGLNGDDDPDAVCAIAIWCQDLGAYYRLHVTGDVSTNLLTPLADVDRVYIYSWDDSSWLLSDTYYNWSSYPGDGSTFELAVPYSDMSFEVESTGGDLTWVDPRVMYSVERTTCLIRRDDTRPGMWVIRSLLQN